MKMTRLEWRYLQRIALDHPYFDTHKLPLTEKEAKAIVEANIKMTGREFVDSIYTKLGMTRPEEKKDRFAWLRNIGELFTVPPIRRIAIAVLVVILMTVFFAATPTGRAIAESVIQYIVTLFDDGALAVNQSNNQVSSDLIPYAGLIDDEQQDKDNIVEGIKYINSFDEFEVETGKTPVKLSMPYTELYYEHDRDTGYLDLNATYETPNGVIVTFQIWNANESVSTTLAGYRKYDIDESLYYSIEKEEGRIYCQKIIEDSIFCYNSCRRIHNR